MFKERGRQGHLLFHYDAGERSLVIPRCYKLTSPVALPAVSKPA